MGFWLNYDMFCCSIFCFTSSLISLFFLYVLLQCEYEVFSYLVFSSRSVIFFCIISWFLNGQMLFCYSSRFCCFLWRDFWLQYKMFCRLYCVFLQCDAFAGNSSFFLSSAAHKLSYFKTIPLQILSNKVLFLVFFSLSTQNCLWKHSGIAQASLYSKKHKLFKNYHKHSYIIEVHMYSKLWLN